MNQVWQGAKEPFKFIGADPDLIRQDPVAGISNALSGALLAELPLDELYQSAKGAIKPAIGKAAKTIEQYTNPKYATKLIAQEDPMVLKETLKNIQKDAFHDFVQYPVLGATSGLEIGRAHV